MFFHGAGDVGHHRSVQHDWSLLVAVWTYVDRRRHMPPTRLMRHPKLAGAATDIQRGRTKRATLTKRPSPNSFRSGCATGSSYDVTVQSAEWRKSRRRVGELTLTVQTASCSAVNRRYGTPDTCRNQTDTAATQRPTRLLAGLAAAAHCSFVSAVFNLMYCLLNNWAVTLQTQLCGGRICRSSDGSLAGILLVQPPNECF